MLGDSVLDWREIFDLFECNLIKVQWYEIPVSVDGLARMLQAGVHHASAIDVKAKVLASTFKPDLLLDGGDHAEGGQGLLGVWQCLPRAAAQPAGGGHEVQTQHGQVHTPPQRLAALWFYAALERGARISTRQHLSHHEAGFGSRNLRCAPILGQPAVQLAQ